MCRPVPRTFDILLSSLHILQPSIQPPNQRRVRVSHQFSTSMRGTQSTLSSVPAPSPRMLPHSRTVVHPLATRWSQIVGYHLKLSDSGYLRKSLRKHTGKLCVYTNMSKESSPYVQLSSVYEYAPLYAHVCFIYTSIYIYAWVDNSLASSQWDICTYVDHLDCTARDGSLTTSSVS